MHVISSSGEYTCITNPSASTHILSRKYSRNTINLIERCRNSKQNRIIIEATPPEIEGQSQYISEISTSQHSPVMKTEPKKDRRKRGNDLKADRLSLPHLGIGSTPAHSTNSSVPVSSEIGSRTWKPDHIYPQGHRR